MAGPRLKSSEAAGLTPQERELRAQTERLRDKCCRAVLAWADGSPQKTAALQRMMDETGLKKSQCYYWINKYRKKVEEGGGPQALRRKPRPDKGQPRSAGRALRAEARRLATMPGYEAEAARLHEEADALDRQFRLKWVAFCSEPQNAGRDVTILRAEYAEAYPGEAEWLPHYTTLKRYLDDADECLWKTAREARRAKSVRHHLTVPYPNHTWQADQRTADVFCLYTDQRTGEIKLRRPLLFHFVDLYSGREMGGFYTWHYDSANVQAAFLDAIYPDWAQGLPQCGTPEHVEWDRGEQHWSRLIVETMRVLGVCTHKGEAHEPTSHGYVEGTHHIVKNSFEAGLPGFCGGDNRETERPLPVRLYAEGEGPEPEWLTLDQLNAGYKAWVRWLDRQEFRKGASRMELFDAGITPERRAVPDRASFGWQIMPQEIRKVSREGMILLRGMTYTGPAAVELKGRSVRVHYLEGDASCVWLADRHGQPLGVCEAVGDLPRGEDKSFRQVGRARRWTNRSLKDLQTVGRAGAALASEGRIDPAEAEALEGSLAAIKRAIREAAPGTTVADIAAAAEPVADLLRLPQREPETRALADDEPEDDGQVVRDVLAGAVKLFDDGTPPPARGGGLFNFTV